MLWYHTLLLSLLNSFWQSSCFFLLGIALMHAFSINSPKTRRNICLLILLAQLLSCLFTCYFFLLPERDSGENINTLSSLINSIPLQISLAICVAYVMIGALLTMRKVITWLLLKKKWESGRKEVSPDIRQFVALQLKLMGISKPVSIWLHDSVYSPLTYGFIRPVILLPVALVNNLTCEETEALIRHELAHIKQHDFIVNWLLLLMESLFFFNPITLLLIRNIRLEQEKECDIKAISESFDALSYCELLLKTAAIRNTISAIAPAATGRKDQLSARVEFLLGLHKGKMPKRNFLSVWFSVSLVMLVFCLLFLASYSNKKESTTHRPFAAIPSLAIEAKKTTPEMPSSLLELKAITELKIKKASPRKKEKDPVQIKKESSVTDKQNSATDQNKSWFKRVSMQNEGTEKLIFIEEEDKDGKKTTCYKVIMTSTGMVSTLIWTLIEYNQPHQHSLSDSLSTCPTDSAV